VTVETFMSAHGPYSSHFSVLFRVARVHEFVH